MAKRCKHCWKVVEDSVRICPVCKNVGFEELPPTALSYMQLQEMAGMAGGKLQARWGFIWKIAIALFLLIFVIIGIPSGVIGWSVLSSVVHTTTNQITSDLKSLNDYSSNHIVSAYADVTNRIANTLSEPHYRQVVEDVAKGQSRSILEEQVRPEVERFRREADFMRTIARAQAYDFKAYQTLLVAARQTNDDASVANEALHVIDRQLLRDRASAYLSHRNLMFMDGTNIYQGPFTSDEVASHLYLQEADPDSYNREGLIRNAWDLHQPLFLGEYVSWLTNETDLTVADLLTSAISDISKEDFHPHDYSRIQEWWASKQNQNTNWPISLWLVGFGTFLLSDYAHATNAFEEVLKIDPVADEARAFLIDSYYEFNQTNRAAELTTGFHDPSSRWKQWATIMRDLHYGSVSNATVELIEFSKANPVFRPVPSPDFPVYKKMDRLVFQKLKPVEAAAK